MWWPAPARLAVSFLSYGCRVSAICPPGHPLRYVSGIEALHSYSRIRSGASLRAAILATRPDLIVPCDDGVVGQLHEIHAALPELRPLIERSLGAGEFYPRVTRRGDLMQTAVRLNIRAPLTQVVRSEDDLKAWGVDAPAVLKIDGTWGGEGVAIVRSQIEAIAGFRRARSSMSPGVVIKRFLINRAPLALWSWGMRKAADVTVQQYIGGRAATAMFACWQGEVVGILAAEVLASQGETGAAVVVRLIQYPEIERAARLIAREYSLSGFHGLDFILEQDTDLPYLIELNPRATQLGHLRVPGQGDLVGALLSKLTNTPADPAQLPHCEHGSTIALFPRALSWNPKSAYLSRGYHDVPWEEPELVRELMRPTWPNRQLASRIYHHFRETKTKDQSDPVFSPIK